MRRAMAGLADDAEETDEDDVAPGAIDQERYAEMSAAEDLILTITRGGLGIRATDKAMRGGPLVSSFPVDLADQVMLVTSAGQSIRVPVEGISFGSRSAGGVKVFSTAKGEKVVSVAWIAETPDEDLPEASGET